MKKSVKIILIAVACIAVFTAVCAIIVNTRPHMTAVDAAYIAMYDAGLTEEQVVKKQSDLKRTPFSMYYEVELYDSATEYDYRIDAVTGEILSFSFEPND